MTANIIKQQVELPSIVAEQEDDDFTMDSFLTSNYEHFLCAIAADGEASLKDIYYNGMYRLIELINATLCDDDANETAIVDLISNIEDALHEKEAAGEINLDYSNLNTDEDDDGLYADDGDEEYINADDDEEEDDVYDEE